MPPPSLTSHLPPTHPAQRQRPKSPTRVLAEAEAQWLFTEAELANTPSIQDGMSAAEETEIRAKGINFIVSVGIMLKLPQITLSTAAVFFQRFLMRASLKRDRGGIPKLHHFVSAATALFLATKVEESCRKMKELVAAFCRVAQKNPNKVVDDQSKDYWRWRDCVLHHEDVLLETLCFDLTVESPHRQLFDMLKWYGLEHNKRLRNAAWAFVTDANNTPLCLLCTSRTVAIAGLYAACRYCDVQLPDDAKGRPWWETQHVRVADVRRAVAYICDSYDPAEKKISGVAVGTGSGSEGEKSIYATLTTPSHDGGVEGTRLVGDGSKAAGSPFALAGMGSERRGSNASSVGMKRGRGDELGGEERGNGETFYEPPHENGDDQQSKRQRLQQPTSATRNGPPSLDPASANDPKVVEEMKRVQGNDERAEEEARTGGALAQRLAPQTTTAQSEREEGEVASAGRPAGASSRRTDAGGSEEGEVEE